MQLAAPDYTNNILVLATAAATFSKIIADFVRMTGPKPSWVPPLVAFLSSVAIVLLLLVAQGITLNWQLAAQSVLAGLIAAASAIASAETGKRGNEAQYQ
jgi:hypothetical protein